MLRSNVGTGQMEQAIVSEKYPELVKGNSRGSINQAVVKSNGPMRLSKPVIADMDTDLRIGRNALTLHKFGVTLPVTAHKVPVIDITDADKPNMQQELNRAPHCTSCQTMYFGHSLEMTG